MVPRTARTRPDSRSACSKSPVISAIAMMKRLPKEWPPSEPSPVKRCWKSWVISGSVSARAVRHWRKSPGGSTRYSARRRPLEPPSSATVTMATMLPVYFLIPRSSVLSPVPPPSATTRGPLASWRWA